MAFGGPPPEFFGIHVMLDLETMGLSANAAITTLAAVQFDPFAPSEDKVIIGRPFVANISLMDSLLLGFDIDSGTSDWWRDQVKDPKQLEMYRSVNNLPCPKSVTLSLDRFDNTLEKWSKGHKMRVRLYCKGPSFDFAILRNAVLRAGSKLQWDFRREQDLRTYLCLAMAKTDNQFVVRTNNAPHVAMSDAMTQALQVWDCCRVLGISDRIKD